MKILITGATGLLGKKIGIELFKQGHDLVVISRSKEKAKANLPFPAEIVEGDLMNSSLSNLPKVDAVIHLLGEGIADKRWSADQKKKLWDSRVIGTQNLLASLTSAPKTFVSASAIGFYGDREGEVLDENSSKGPGFLPDLCEAWEKEVSKLSSQTRLVILRIGIVLSKQGGALTEMSFPFRVGVGGALGTGRQMMSWIHIDDLVNLFIESLSQEKYQGVFNAVASSPVSNSEFSKLLAQQLHRPKLPNIPKLVLKSIFGELSVVLLSDQNVRSKLESLGFQFQFTDLKSALNDLLKEEADGEDVLEAFQFLPYPVEKVFEFFCEAKNLERITPDTLHFKIVFMSTNEIQAGTLIDYQLKIHGVPAKWRTLIQDWSPPFRFVDTQVKGPYRLWHHTHTFQSVRGGTLMQDRVRFKLPVGYLGWLVAGAFVRKDVEQIFAYRKKVISEIQEEIFSKTSGSTNF